MVTAAGDPDFSVLARRHHWIPQTIPFPGTIGVENAPELFHALQPILQGASW